MVLLELLTGLPPIDNDRDPPDLVGYLDELEEQGDIEDLLDQKFPKSEWRQVSAKKIYQISQDCLKKKKERPSEPKLPTECQHQSVSRAGECLQSTAAHRISNNQTVHSFNRAESEQDQVSQQ